MNLIDIIGLNKGAYILLSLYLNGPLRKTDIAKSVNSNYAIISNLVKKLKWHTLITDQRGADNRERKITLTQKGTDMAMLIDRTIKICKEYDESERRKRLKIKESGESNTSNSPL